MSSTVSRRRRARWPRRFALTAADRAGEVAIRTREDAFTITWGELRERVDALAGGLARLGLRRGQTLALMLSNRPEFHLCDLAGMMIGATPFSIYNTYTAEQIAYLVNDAEAQILICEQQYLPQVLEARRELPGLAHVIVVDGEAPEGVLALAEVEGSDPGFDVEASVAQIQPQRHPHADLHIGHDRAAEGRAADPPQPARRGRGPRGADPRSRATAA